MDTSKALNDILSFMKEAGALALQNQGRAKISYKDGNQALTETDLAISQLAQQRLKTWFDQPNHILIDEESINLTPDEAFSRYEYQWSLDPIDGTAGYALGRRLYGTSLGVFHKGKPLLGVIYFPAIQELLVADETRAWRVVNPFTPDAKEEPLQCRPMDVHSQIFVESFFGKFQKWDEPPVGKIWLNTPESALQGFMSVLTSQAAGAASARMFAIWDVAASVAMAQRAGFSIRSLSDGRVLSTFQPSDFKENWKMSDVWLICADENFDFLSNALKE